MSAAFSLFSASPVEADLKNLLFVGVAVIVLVLGYYADKRNG